MKYSREASVQPVPSVFSADGADKDGSRRLRFSSNRSHPHGSVLTELGWLHGALAPKYSARSASSVLSSGMNAWRIMPELVARDEFRTLRTMNTRIFGKTGRVVGEVGLGTWQIGGNWGDVTDDTALATLRGAYDAGTTFFDTADVYGDGRSETLIGRFLKESKLRDRVFIATKLGRRGDPGWPKNFTREVVRQHTEDSLSRLGVEALDLTQFHCVPPEVLMRGELFGWVEELKQEGKIKAYGASVEAMDEALWCCAQPGCASLQIIFNIFRQKPIHVLFDQARRNGVALIVRLPLASGLLGGRMTKATKFPADDHRNFNRDGQSFNVGETFAGLPFEKGVELADALKAGVPTGLTLAEMALRWCLDFDAVSVIIPGARNVAQAQGNARASVLAPLGAERHVKLAAFYERDVAAHIRGPY